MSHDPESCTLDLETAGINMDPELYAAITEQYHASIREHETDILALDVPKLRRPQQVTHGVIEACTEPSCRICEPHTEATLTKLRTYGQNVQAHDGPRAV